MKLDENYRIEKDELSYQLIFKRKYISKDGKNKGKEVVSESSWYYPTLSGALKGYLNKVSDVSEDVETLLNQLLHLEEFIEKLVKNEFKR